MKEKKKTSNFKFIRIVILLFILASVWNHFNTQKKVVTNWLGTQDVVITPINVDQLNSTAKGIAALSASQFEEIDEYLSEQASVHGLNLKHSINIRLGKEIDKLPPALPQQGASRWEIAWWSLKLRWWAWKNKTEDSHSTQINLYILYSSPKPRGLLPHSTGLQKGLIGLIHLSALPVDQRRNNMIITHELLHIFGATDKYELSTGRPIFPDGYAEPDKKNPHPQRRAEIMAGRIPINEIKFARVERLKQTVIGRKTAEEIGWTGL